MAKKRSTLPKELDALLEAGDIEVLKSLFSRCEPNALTSRTYGSNIFSKSPLPRDFAVWAREQGADVNFVDYYGKTPIFHQAGSWRGEVQLLIDLGADVQAAAGGVTPLHHAAMYGRPKAVKALLDAGADVEARPEEPLFHTRQSPLEMTLHQNRVPFATLLEVCSLLLEHGARITEDARKAVAAIGEQFERARPGIQNPEFLTQQTEALERLYEIFDVPPAKPVEVHDGVSPIVITEEGFAKQYQKLWDYLVPPQGRARTAQGEAIRIAGRVSHEILDNGGRNWDGDYRKMLRVLPEYFKLGDPLSGEDLAEVSRLARALRDGQGNDEPELLCVYAVKWILKNPDVLPPFPADYGR
ncbi:ankyrin repeat domain-containing protein [uncultured Dysosmobacter sp.]|uniref:ankyrin repeat domain-containing protein n=1 Tax=uncultured Dysosmobacter sp. TaxID=2591384 RepID=UPI002624DF73|nr:ankyrin repeat domain-containing protein [uncultured Dysosmobacter sp.]